MACGTLFAQEEQKEAIVSVENDYNPVVVQVNKKIFTPTVEGRVESRPSELIFSKQATPFTGFTSEKSSEELLPEQDKSQPGYLRLGYGIRNDMDGKLSYNVRFSEKSILRAYASFEGFNSKVNGIDGNGRWKTRMYNTDAILDYTYKFQKLHLNIDGSFNNRSFNYQRAEKAKIPVNWQHHTNYYAGMSAVSQLAGPFAYSIRVAYTHSLTGYSDGQKKPISEDHIKANAGFSYEIYSKNLRKIGFEIDFNYFIYNSALLKARKGYQNLMSMDFSPYTDFNFNGWKLLAGVNLNFRNANGPIVAAAPNIRIEKNFNKRISYYAKATGGRKDNSFAVIEGITPYWGYNSNSDRQIKPTYKIVDVATGTRITFEPFSFDLFAGYALTKDDLLQQIGYSGAGNSGLIYTVFAQEYTHNAYAETRLGYDYGGWLNIAADARYDFWNCKDKDLLAFKPEVTTNANIEVMPIKGLSINAGYNFTLYTKTATQGRLECKHDLHARISYKINRMFGVFITGDNLLNREYYEYYGYYTRGIRGMLGATMNF